MFYKLFFRIRILFCRIIKRPLFIIKVENGITTIVFGSVRNGFLNDCAEIFYANNISFAFIYAINTDYGKPTLHSSVELSKDGLQQLRNCWSVR